MAISWAFPLVIISLFVLFFSKPPRLSFSSPFRLNFPLFSPFWNNNLPTPLLLPLTSVYVPFSPLSLHFSHSFPFLYQIVSFVSTKPYLSSQSVCLDVFQPCIFLFTIHSNNISLNLIAFHYILIVRPASTQLPNYTQDIAQICPFFISTPCQPIHFNEKHLQTNPSIYQVHHNLSATDQHDNLLFLVAWVSISPAHYQHPYKLWLAYMHASL